MSSLATLEPEITRDELDALGDEIAASAARMTAALGRWLELVARYDALRGWASWGATSCAEWLAWRCSLSPVTAREHVRVARRLTELPLIAAALRRGELSFSKVRAVCRLDHVSDEEQVLELARHATASQLERFVRLARGVTRAQASAAVRNRYLHVDFDDDGAAEIRVRVPAEDGALLLRALDHVSALLDASTEEPAPADGPAEEAPGNARWTPPPSPGRRADALVWMADQALTESADEDTGRATGDRREVVVHVDAALLTKQEGPAVAGSAASLPGAPRRLDRPPACHLDNDDGAALAAETVRRLCCDAGIVAVVRDGDRTLAVGRRTRAIGPALRRALRVRRPECAFPGCRRTRWLDAHHLVHWAHGGTTDLDNLVHLCRHHHRLVHEGDWALSLGPDGRCTARSPGGRLLTDAPADALVVEADDHAMDPGPQALTPLSLGQRYDLELTVDALVAWTAPPDPNPDPDRCMMCEHPLAA